MSTIKTNAIQTVAGKPILNSTGSILQVVQGILGSTFSATSTDNGTSGYLVDVTGLSATITPTSTTSKILIFTNMYIGTTSVGGGYQQHYVIKRGGTIITALKGTNEGFRPTVTGKVNMYSPTAAHNTYSMAVLSGVHYDSPGSTSALTYQIAMGGYSGSAVMYVNRSEAFQNASSYDSIPQSTLTLMEISA